MSSWQKSLINLIHIRCTLCEAFKFNEEGNMIPLSLEIPGSTTWRTGSISWQSSVFLFKTFLVGFGCRIIISRYAATKACFTSNITKCWGVNVLNNLRKRASIALVSLLSTSLNNSRANDTVVAMRLSLYRCWQFLHSQSVFVESVSTCFVSCNGVLVPMGFVDTTKPSWQRTHRMELMWVSSSVGSEHLLQVQSKYLPSRRWICLSQVL